MNIELVDLLVIVVYFVGITGVGLWSIRRMKMTSDAYFLAGRALNWGVIGSAMFAANISTIHMVGLAQDGYQRGLVVGNFEWMATFTLILLALVFAPFYFRSRISTLPEFLEKRYGPLARSIMAFMAILAAMLIHIGISLYAGAEVFDRFFGINVTVSIAIISLVTAIYTVVGGLKAVVVTETIQSVVLLGGAVVITVLGLNKLPEKGIHSWGQLNMAIDVQHSAESLDQAANILAGADWLLTDTRDFGSLQGQFETVAELLRDGKLTEAKGRVQAIARSAGDARLGALKTLLAMHKLEDVARAIDAKPAAGTEEEGESFRPKTAEFTEAARAVGRMAQDSKTVAADLLWAIGKDIKESEKLGFVSGVLQKTGHEELAALLADPSQWDNIGSQTARLAVARQAAADLRQERTNVLQTADMAKYLATDRPIRTPRLSMLRAEGPYFWLAILLGYPVLGVWYWCSDQTIVQRVLGAKDLRNAQNGALFAGLLKITPVFFMVLPGTIAFVILRDKIGDRSAQTLPVMITELMPIGLKGLMAAALLAALMSTIAAALNSAGTLVAIDIVGKFRPQTSDAARVRIGRISSVVVMLLAMAWSTQGGRFGTIFEVINKIPALFLAPPITTVFVWGVFWKRGTKQAATTTLILGLSAGFVLFLVDTGVFGGVEWVSDPRRGLGIPFMLQAAYMFVVWSVLYVVVSLLTPAPPPEQVENTTWPNPLAVIFHGKLTGLTDPRLLSLGLLVMMIGLYYWFR